MMKIKKFNVYIIVKTGLHIGGDTKNIGIGEMDNPVIKDRNGFPYIPGSSLKGKLRSLYELDRNKIGPEGGPYEFDGKDFDEISMFFGKAGKVTDNLDKLGPTRFIFRDLKLAKKEDIENLDIKSFDKEDLYTLEDYQSWQNEGKPLTEEKYENVINRKTGTTKKGGLRQIERVFAGSVFKGELIVRLFERKEIIENWNKKINALNQSKIEKLFGKDYEKKFKSEEEIMKYCFWIFKNKEKWDIMQFGYLKQLLENDYLGGMGTRGSGQVEIIFECIEGCDK